MARARNIKPGFFKNEILAEMPPETRLLFMGLWCLADREGRFEDRPKKIKMELFPCDDFSIEDGLALLAEGGFLIRYEVEGRRYAQVVNFTKHQMPHHKEVPSEIPAPPGHAQVTKHAYDVPRETREAVFYRDGMACLKCGATESLSLDHVIPLASGGDNGIDNLQTLCKSCNSAKGNTTKDYRKGNVKPTLRQQRGNDSAHCPTDSLIPDSLIPDSLNLIPDSLQKLAAQDAALCDALPADDEPQRKTSGTPKRAMQLPDDFEPDDTAVLLAAELGVSISAELPKFRDYHAARGKPMKDWQAALRTWLRNAKQFAKPTAKQTESDRRAAWLADITGRNGNAIDAPARIVG